MPTSVDKSAFETQINQRISMTNEQLPRVTFNAKEMYNEAHSLCQKIPTWSGQSKNPINHFVPSQEQAFKPREDVEKAMADQERIMRYT